MILLKAVHEARIAAKDAEIARLKDEVAWLRNYLQPTRRPSPTSPLEADLVLEGRQDPIETPSENQDPQDLAILRERDRILSGTY